jgi:DNA-3-methyladenine glycosylase I
VTTADAPSLDSPAAKHPLEDGRTRCSWVAGHPRHYAFHDAEYGMIPDDEGLSCERLLLAAFQRGRTLCEVLDHRDALWEQLEKWDLAKIAALSDEALDGLTKAGGLFKDRRHLAWVRDVAAAGAETAKAAKGLREYYLAVRFLAPEEQIRDMVERFPGFSRQDAAHLIELVGGGAGGSHERDCWRA